MEGIVRFIMLICGGLFLITLVVLESGRTTKLVCVYPTVVSIDSLNYRDAWITLSNGEQVSVNQASLTVGSSFKHKKFGKCEEVPRD